ncbi:hypothetical protein SIN8267_00624 [Sinobacterium norvegicum]|uniref:YecA family protein n=1 Tax=Sinobacterium norvegicum TaxID=1641715 RepID=A0ABM9ABF1_9GAMM|nr:UPF0149 family protein [Sinobacterium norvegicum]CAH0990532.1 hypothetical protein SIN8267_00624 [Sinobacterium norvegicum]
MSLIRPSEPLERLAKFLSSKQCHEHSMNIEQLDGYLRAVASAPVRLGRSFYSELIFAGKTPRCRDEAQKQQLAEDLEALLDFHRLQVAASECDVLFHSRYTTDKAKRIDAEQWCRGFMQGYIVVEKEWEELLDGCTDEGADAFEAVLDNALECISVVADAGFAEQQGVTEQQIANQFINLPAQLQYLATLGQALSRWMMTHRPEVQQRFSEEAEPATSTKVVGRNESCPCGSGKKYKKCCG